MSLNTYAAKYAPRTKEAQRLRLLGFAPASTERQLRNGTLAVRGKIAGREVTYQVHANGAVRTNFATSRRVEGRTEGERIRAGLLAVAELIGKRRARAA
jgi:hypothetical protein